MRGLSRMESSRAPAGYNDPAVPRDMPVSPMDPVPAKTGFRWG